LAKHSKQHYSKQDPHYERELQKYGSPIPSREFIMDYLEKVGEPLSRKRLIEALGLESEEEKEAFRRRLIAMERDGQLITNRRNRYALVDKLELVSGRVLGRKDGFGFVVPDDASPDVTLTSYQMRAVFPGDRVLVRIAGIDRRGRREGVIVEVIERNTQQVVGRYFEEGGVAFVVPEKKGINQDVLIAPEDRGAARQGQLVVAAVIVQPTARRQARGQVIEVLGEKMAPGMEIETAIRSYGLPHLWFEDVLEETQKFTKEVPELAKEGRVDLRPLALVTIDGEDAQDFDDAVYCEPQGKNGWRLIVAIADVAHYVKPNTSLDQEAYKRGNSVYFPGRVLPMLPEALSNGLCSLKPHVDRLAMVCDMSVDKEGHLKKYEFYEAIIKSHNRLTYTAVAAMLEGKETASTPTKSQQDLLMHLEELHRLYKQLHARRQSRGAIDFETTETRVVFDENRKVKAILPTQRNDAHRIIEECMLLANVASAQFLAAQKIPILFRIHEGPSAEKLEVLKAFLASLNLRLGGKDNPTSMDYAKLLQSIEGRPDAQIIQIMLLRSMRQAVYAPPKKEANNGHFGLAYEGYTHFTSPIRRYPDLLIHRAIKYFIQGGTVKKYPYDMITMQNYGQHCSMTERRADDATREVIDWLKCEFMLNKVGERFEGVISEVLGFGIFVELKDFYIEGLVHITSLKNDYYHFDQPTKRLVGKRSGMVYKLGDTLQVLVARVSLDDREIDFELVSN
jgi:ribonuclease R